MSPRYDTPTARSEHAAEVNEMVATWIRQHTKHKATAIIGATGIPADAVLDTLELANDPTFELRGIKQTIDHPTIRPFKMVAWPVHFSGSPPLIKPYPLLVRNK